MKVLVIGKEGFIECHTVDEAIKGGNKVVVSRRLANVYDYRQNSKGEAEVVTIFCDKMLSRQQPIINGDGKQTRDFVYVEDIVEAGILAIKSKKVGIYNIGTVKETDINTIFRKLKKLTIPNCKEIHIPENPGEQKRSCLDFSKTKKNLTTNRNIVWMKV